MHVFQKIDVPLQAILRNHPQNRDVAQLVAHYVRDVGVGRSSRLIPTKARGIKQEVVAAWQPLPFLFLSSTRALRISFEFLDHLINLIEFTGDTDVLRTMGLALATLDAVVRLTVTRHGTVQ